MLLDPTVLLETFGLFAIAAVIFIESGFPFGFFLPGDTFLFAAGLLAGHGHFPIWAAMIVALIAAIGGVTCGYLSGKHLGQRWLKKEKSFLFRRDYVERATQFYERYGGVAVILCRFVPGARSFVPFIAGIVRMDYGRFMLYNVIGGILWAIGVPLLGYFAGGWLEARGINVEALILPIVAAIVVISLLAPVAHSLLNRESRAKLLARFKK